MKPERRGDNKSEQRVFLFGGAVCAMLMAGLTRKESPVRRFARELPLLLLYGILALWVVSPVLSAPRSRIVGWAGDNVQYVYITGWMGQALLLNQSPFVDPRLNYPDDLNLMATDIPYVGILAVAPATWFLGPVAAYNLLIVLCFWLSGYFTALWVRGVTGSRAGGGVAGLVFLLAPYRVVHSYGHLQLVSTWAIPLFFWSLDSLLRRPVPRWFHLLALAGAAFLVGSSAQYYLVICLVAGACYGVLVLLPRGPIGLLRRGGLAALSMGAGFVASAFPYLLTLNTGVYVPYDVASTRMWSADPLTFLLPSRLHPLWGTFFLNLRPEPLWIEKTLYLGIVASILALVALVHALAKRESLHRSHVLVWSGVALAGAIFALGTDLHLNGHPLQEHDPFWLPASYLAHLPFVNMMRTWARFGIIPIFFVAALAGVGTTVLLAPLRRRPRSWRYAVVALVGGLIILDGAPGKLEYTTVEPRPVDHWLAEQPGHFAVAALPPGLDQVNHMAMYGSLFHGKHMPAYNHPTHQPPAYRDFARRAAMFPEATSLQALREMNLRYLFIERRFFDGKLFPDYATVATALRRSPDVQIVIELDGVVVVAFQERIEK